MENRKQIIVTGGLGHIGSSLLKGWTHTPFTVIDNFATQRYCSLFGRGSNVDFVEKDIEHLTVNDLRGCQVLIHLAALTNAEASMSQPDLIEKENVQKAKKLIDTAKAAGVLLFVFPSSTSVYGIASEMVTEDNPSAINPQSPYAESKVVIENYLKESGLNYIIFRLGTIFGVSRGIRFHTAINKFCYQAVMHLPLTIWKQNYKMYRPYLGLLDAKEVLLKAVEGYVPPNQTYNVLTANYTLEEIVHLIKKEQSNVVVSYVDTPLLNQYSYKVSDAKIRAYGFEPHDDLANAIHMTTQMLRPA